MTDLAYTITGIDAIDAAASRALNGMAMRGPVERVGERYVQTLKDESPEGRGEQPGRLRKAYQVSSFYAATQSEYTIRNTTPYLRWVLNGRGAVTVKRAKALRFVINGQVFFRRMVGPAEPNRFDERARQAMDGDLSALPADVAAAVVRSWYGGS